MDIKIFKIPKTIKHKEARKHISNLVRHLNDEGMLTEMDIPQLHRMATAYDAYLTCVDVLSEEGMTDVNTKGETVKRPEANLIRENWNQYLEIAREYGLTAKSKKQLSGASSGKSGDTPADDFFKDKE